MRTKFMNPCRLLVFLFAALGAAVIPTLAQQKTILVAEVKATEHLSGQRYALIIGINDYADDQIPDLQFAEADAQAIYDVLVDPQTGGLDAENATLLLGKNASKRNILKALSNLRTVPKDATVFIFYSGHGAKEAGEAFWVTQDAELGGLGYSAIPDREIRTLTARIPTERLMMFLDCCYAAATIKEQKSVVDISGLMQRFVGSGRVTITASGSGEEAIESEDLEHGVFAHYLEKGMRGEADGSGGEADGVITVPELTDYIDRTVAEAARRRKGIQKPRIFMEDVKDPAKFLVTIYPERIASLAEERRLQGETIRTRLAALKRLAIEDQISVALHSQSKRLLRAEFSSLDAQDRERLTLFVELVEGEIPANRLQALLDSIETPEQRSARLERERKRLAEHARRKQFDDMLAEVESMMQRAGIAGDPPERIPEAASEIATEAMGMIGQALAMYPTDGRAKSMKRLLEQWQSSPKELTVDLGGGVSMELVLIPAGELMMGSPETEEGRDDDEGPQHRVRVEKPFYMGKYEVTNAQYRRFKRDHDSGSYRGLSLNNDNQPVVEVSWEDAKAFCAWMSNKSGYAIRLPSASEWEYACRAGSSTRYFWGNDEPSAHRFCNGYDPVTKSKFEYDWDAFPTDDGHRVAAPVGTYRANDFGLYDMHGNVWEWCEDKWHDSYNGAPTDGSAWTAGNSESRVLRGGSWSSNPQHCRSAIRYWNTPDYRGSNIGFRVAVGT